LDRKNAATRERYANDAVFREQMLADGRERRRMLRLNPEWRAKDIERKRMARKLAHLRPTDATDLGAVDQG
jgi:hypothetical protein